MFNRFMFWRIKCQDCKKRVRAVYSYHGRRYCNPCINQRAQELLNQV